ncbi:MAG TPA: putative glycolipid-binding domain-containing protein [Chitinophagaceae bacterium]
MAEKVITWKSEEYHSVEECVCDFEPALVKINGHIDGATAGAAFTIKYSIVADQNWQTLSFNVAGNCGIKRLQWHGFVESGGLWRINGDAREDLEGCIDIDLSLSPSTNSLPVNRLFRGSTRDALIKVVYLDVLNQQISAKFQQYLRLSAGKFNYQNVPNDFEADITVDEDGFVISYPKLFERLDPA